MEFLHIFQELNNSLMRCNILLLNYRVADKSLALPERKQTRKHVRDARNFNNIETRAVIKSPPPLHSKAPTEIHAILTETLACFLPSRANDLSAPLYFLNSNVDMFNFFVFTIIRGIEDSSLPSHRHKVVM